MTASNHVVAGALIAATISQPAVAIPLAFASHFVMDAMPHYGDNNQHSWLRRNFKYVLAMDLLLAASFLGAIVALQPDLWGWLVAGAVAAVLPDVLWLPYFLADLRHEEIEHSRLAKFLKWIQWAERPWGIYLEIIVLAALSTFFWQIVR